MSVFRGLSQQAEVVHALVLRETRTRFGAYQLGYLWALLEPTIQIITFFVFFRVMKRPAPEGMDLFSFIATGVVPYTLFASSANRVADAINGNKALLFYPQVKPLDLVFARASLELATYGFVFIALLGVHALWVQRLEIDRFLLVLGGMVMVGALGSTTGLIFCTLSEVSNSVERARGPILRPLFWMSGIFFTADTLPQGVREVMLWNPILHCTEMVRDGWFVDYDSPHYGAWYVATWILALGFCGLILERMVRRRIELS